MSPALTLLVALRAVARSKLRSGLTVLGIVIGVGAVIATMALGAGATAQIEQAFAALGTNQLVVGSGTSSAGGSLGGAGTLPTLTWEDLAAIRTELPSVTAAAPQLRSTQSIAGDELNWTTTVIGTTADLFEMRAWPAASGVHFTSADVDAGAKVVVLGQTTAERLFGGYGDPIGQTVRIGRTPFVVVGVLARKGQGASGQDYDDAAFVPFTTYARRIQGGLGKFIAGSIYVQTTSNDAVPRAAVEVQALLRQRHRIPSGAEDDFSVKNLAEAANAQQQGTETMTTLLAAVAAVSLVVGGLGIMNIMLVNVTDRTREIGLRISLGAKPRSILLQFLAEALLLAIVGGVLGVGAGVGASAWLASRFRWVMVVQPNAIAMAVGFSALVGLVFGLYPARRASVCEPIEALRYE